MKYKIADLIVEFESKFKLLEERSRKYEIESMGCDFQMQVTDENIDQELKSDLETTPELAEYSIMGSTFYRELLRYNGCLLHSSVVVIDNEAYVFSAPCGTGKSTHTSLWLKYLKHKNPYILNDDKPAIRIIDDDIWIYGTPFSGKNDINENKKVKIKGICFIEQANENSIEVIKGPKAIKMFLEQTLRKLNKNEIGNLLSILDVIIKNIPMYKLCCNISEEAVQLSYKTMNGENTYEN